MTEILYVAGQIFVPIFLYILAGYYASNAKWCSRKVIVSVVVGLGIGVAALGSGIEVSDSWLHVAFASPAVLGAMYMADRIVKGIAKRFEIAWLYTDEPCEVVTQ